MTTQHPRTTLITGAGSGIGAALARSLADRGERVVGVDLRNAEFVADLADASARASLVERISQQYSALDAVVACAGVMAPPAEVDTVISVNYFGVTKLLPLLLPLLHRGRRPRAVAICSTASLLELDIELIGLCLAGDEGSARKRAQEAGGAKTYSSSKRALIQWIRRTAVGADWAGRGVLLNGIAPGCVKTPMTLPLLASEEGRELLAKSVPLAVQDYAVPDDIAPLLAFLSGPENRYMVGQVTFCDGGSEVLLRGEEKF